jgi:hypothetical protein
MVSGDDLHAGSKRSRCSRTTPSLADTLADPRAYSYVGDIFERARLVIGKSRRAAHAH